MAGRLAGKRALITGGASGLGRTMAQMFVAEGARVVLTDINAEGVAAAAAEINAATADAALALAHDVRSEAEWIDVVDAADGFLGGINVLVNNAGVGATGNLEVFPFEEWRRVMDIDVDSVFLGAKHALKSMKHHQPGSIINISSIAGLVAGYNFAAYNAAKAAVWMLSKSIAMHCVKQGYNIRSNSIHPAFIKTPILQGIAPGVDDEVLIAKLAKQIPMGRVGDASDVGYLAIYLASDESGFMTGAELKLDGGLSAP